MTSPSDLANDARCISDCLPLGYQLAAAIALADQIVNSPPGEDVLGDGLGNIIGDGLGNQIGI